jgi:hypothetical protein
MVAARVRHRARLRQAAAATRRMQLMHEAMAAAVDSGAGVPADDVYGQLYLLEHGVPPPPPPPPADGATLVQQTAVAPAGKRGGDAAVMEVDADVCALGRPARLAASVGPGLGDPEVVDIVDKDAQFYMFGD